LPTFLLQKDQLFATETSMTDAQRKMPRLFFPANLVHFNKGTSWAGGAANFLNQSFSETPHSDDRVKDRLFRNQEVIRLPDDWKPTEGGIQTRGKRGARRDR
jgi:hypothetical protein